MSALEAIYNFLPLSDSIATAGQPTEAQFSAVKAAGYEVIVNLALPESTNALPHEQAIVESQGLKYVHIPVVWESPTMEDFQRFVTVLDTHSDQKVFVHCAANMRVSAFIYLYRRLKGIPADTAQQDLQQIWTPNETWQAFIEEVEGKLLP